MPSLIDLSGKTFGRWFVRRRVGAISGCASWECICECTTVRVVSGSGLRTGRSTSCGCKRVETLKAVFTTHGHARLGEQSAEYRIWCGMKNRCQNDKTEDYDAYGGRGIRVCERWRDFASFFADMGPRPSGRHSIDRKDVDGNYEPSNCRWATALEQMRNRRPKNVIELHGQKKDLTVWAKETGLKPRCVRRRLARGLSIEEALKIPARLSGRATACAMPVVT